MGTLTSEGVSLFANADFLNWAAEEENSYLDDPLSPVVPNEEYPDYLLHVFGFFDDECPFVTVEELLYAL